MDKGIFSIAASFVEEFNDRVGQLSRLTNHPSSKGRFIESLVMTDFTSINPFTARGETATISLQLKNNGKLR